MKKDRIEYEAELQNCEEILADYRRELAWLEGPENTPATNDDYEFTQRDIEGYEEEIRELVHRISQLKRLLNIQEG